MPRGLSHLQFAIGVFRCMRLTTDSLRNQKTSEVIRTGKRTVILLFPIHCSRSLLLGVTKSALSNSTLGQRDGSTSLVGLGPFVAGKDIKAQNIMTAWRFRQLINHPVQSNGSDSNPAHTDPGHLESRDWDNGLEPGLSNNLFY